MAIDERVARVDLEPIRDFIIVGVMTFELSLIKMLAGNKDYLCTYL
jgi:hypothetical protein